MRGLNRKIIIPKGTLNSNDINIVVVPPSLQHTSQPLIVKPTAGNKLAALSLPIWGDELDSSPEGKARYERDSPPPTSDSSEDIEFPDFETSTWCQTSPESTPRLVYVSTKKTKVTNDGPPETFEMVFDASSEGVDPNVFEAVVQEGVKENRSYQAFQPQDVSSLDELNFDPMFHSSLTGDYGCQPLADSSMYYPEVRSLQPPGGEYQPQTGCGSGGWSTQRNVSSAQYMDTTPCNDAYSMAQQRQHTKRAERRARKAHRQSKQSGCGSCSSGY